MQLKEKIGFKSFLKSSSFTGQKDSKFDIPEQISNIQNNRLSTVSVYWVMFHQDTLLIKNKTKQNNKNFPLPNNLNLKTTTFPFV